MTTNKTIFITGSSTGIGLAIAELFAAKGWKVIATMRRPDPELPLAKVPNITLLPLDVTENQSIENALQKAIELVGPIQVLVNNAGYGALGPFEAASQVQIHRQFDTNVFGLMSVTQAFIPHFRQNNGGTIINISSVGGRVTFPLYSIYHSTKWAVEGFSESLSFELAPFGIKIRCVEPGPIKTDFYSRSQDVLQKEGLTVYDSLVNKLLPRYLSEGNNAPGPEVVARVVYQAAIDKSANFKRLAAGGTAKFALFSRSLFPLSWFMAVIKSQLGLK